ncbi:MAG: hypothetical protein ABI841_03030 [Chloroflexota bacterium]
MTAHQVRLRVHDANSVTRRKDWNVELSGALETTDDGTALVGVIDVPDRRVLEGLMLLFRLVGAVFGLIALALAARGIVTDGELGLPPVLGLVVAAALTLGPSYVAREGERSAGEDAALLARSVHDILNAGRWRG